MLVFLGLRKEMDTSSYQYIPHMLALIIIITIFYLYVGMFDCVGI